MPPSFCNSGGGIPSDFVGGIVSRSAEGIITLGKQTYSNEYGSEIAQLLESIWENAPLIDKLEGLRQQSASDARTEAILETLAEISFRVEAELDPLASAHTEKWTQLVAFDPSLELEADEDMGKNDRLARDHFEKSINAYEVLLQVRQRSWEMMKSGAGEGLSSFSIYNQEAMTSGQSALNLNMANMYHSRYNHLGDAENSDDCVAAYEHLVQAGNWCAKSLSIFGVDMDGEYMEDVWADLHLTEEVATTVNEATRLLATIQLSFAALLLDMYSAGYIVDADGNTRLESPIAEDDGQIENGRRQILIRARATSSSAANLYEKVEDPEKVADSFHYMGVALSHLLEWSDAVIALEYSLDNYEQVLEEDLGSESLEVAKGMVQTTNSLCDAYLNLHGKTTEAEEVFRRHLTLRRYVERQVPFDEPLSDEEYSDDPEQIAFHINDEDADDNQESLMALQKLLDEYTQSIISDYGPDGLVYELGFDAYEGISPESYVQHDQIYEGSIRSSIGRLHLGQQHLVEAKVELELAVGLLREALYEGRDTSDSHVSSEKSVKLELACALLHLAYAEMGPRLWRSSAENFQLAMELYASELSSEQTPMDHP
ncbi:hypothetical protein ACHAXT_011413 [Thalassiosira profunda]